MRSTKILGLLLISVGIALIVIGHLVAGISVIVLGVVSACLTFRGVVGLTGPAGPYGDAKYRLEFEKENDQNYESTKTN